MADEILDRADVMCQLFGKRQGLAYQTGHTLPESSVAAFDVIGFPRVLRDRLVLFRRHHPSISLIVIRVERRLFPVDQGELAPPLFGTLATPITPMKRNDLAGLGLSGVV